jgi:hypothetical protein
MLCTVPCLASLGGKKDEKSFVVVGVSLLLLLLKGGRGRTSGGVIRSLEANTLFFLYAFKYSLSYSTCGMTKSQLTTQTGKHAPIVTVSVQRGTNGRRKWRFLKF